MTAVYKTFGESLVSGKPSSNSNHSTDFTDSVVFSPITHPH